MTSAEQEALLDLLREIALIEPDPDAQHPCYAQLQIMFVDEPEWTTRFQTDGTLLLVLRLIIWAPWGDPAAPAVRDIKEQQCRLHHRHLTDPARAQVFLRAWAEVIARVCEDGERVAACLPWDLFDPRPLMLKRPQTHEQFIKSLSVKSRLGRYLL